MSHIGSPDYVWLVPKDSPLGRRLSLFTPFGLRVLEREFAKKFVVTLSITASDEPDVRHGIYVEFPRYEIAFDAHVLLLGHFAAFEQLAFHTGTLNAPEPE